MASSASPKRPPASPKKAHLITTPGFATSLLINLLVMSAALAAIGSYRPTRQLAMGAYDWVTFQMMNAAHRAAWWWAIGLLSSSCCAIQIILNLFSVGCAGFNTYLGPVRPTFVAVTLLTQLLTWTVAYNRPWQWPAAAVSSAVAFCLTLLPEALALWVHLRSAAAPPPGTLAGAGGPSLSFNIPTMGCISCVATITSALEAADPGVGRVEVSLETGAAVVLLAGSPSAAERRRIKAVLNTKLTAAGFPAVAGQAVAGQADAAADAADGEARSPSRPAAARSSADSAADSGCCDDRPAAASWQHFGASIVAGLLSSSCCLLQLALNLLAALNMAHIGCAGFNKVLGPWRTELRAVTALYLAGLWAVAFSRQWPKRGILISTVLAVVLALLPELLKAAGGPSLAPPVDGFSEVLHLKLDGMGCEACQLHVKGLLERSDGVIASTVDFEAGTADVMVSSGWNFNLTDVGARLAYDGYDILESTVEKAAAAAAAAAGDHDL